MQLQSWSSVDSSLYCALKQNRTEKQPMHASHSHNYYFIKELLPLAGVLWHCCKKPGRAPEGGWGMWVWGRWQGDVRRKGGRWVGRKHALIWVISQSARGRVTEPPLHLVSKHICCTGYPPELIALIIPDTRGRGS